MSDSTLCQIFRKFCMRIFPKPVKQGWVSWKMAQWPHKLTHSSSSAILGSLMLVFSYFHLIYSSVSCLDSLFSFRNIEQKFLCSCHFLNDDCFTTGGDNIWIARVCGHVDSDWNEGFGWGSKQRRTRVYTCLHDPQSAGFHHGKLCILQQNARLFVKVK